MERLGPISKWEELIAELAQGEYSMCTFIRHAIHDVLDADKLKKMNGRIVYLEGDKLVSEHHFEDEETALEIEDSLKPVIFGRDFETSVIERLRNRDERVVSAVFSRKDKGELKAFLVYPESYENLFPDILSAEDRSGEGAKMRLLSLYFLARVPLDR